MDFIDCSENLKLIRYQLSSAIVLAGRCWALYKRCEGLYNILTELRMHLFQARDWSI